MMLKFYGYYKQATIGPCDDPKPSFWEVIKRAKWEAWHKLGNMSSEEAMLLYVEDLKQVKLNAIFCKLIHHRSLCLQVYFRKKKFWLGNF